MVERCALGFKHIGFFRFFGFIRIVVFAGSKLYGYGRFRRKPGNARFSRAGGQFGTGRKCGSSRKCRSSGFAGSCGQ